ncbi:MAG: phosphatidylserine decarboxylase [Lachnospiraceae bacterium]|nr:phosphatidylserine decarboxylase [Lachnospiraceae bacterium]
MLTWLYDSVTGRRILRLLTAPWISRAAGRFMDSRLSKPVIKPFIRAKGIDVTEAADGDWQSFNAFFTRPLKAEARPVDPDPEAFISPCDGYLKAQPIEAGVSITVKDVPYTIAELLRSEGLAKHFEGGTCLVFRLTPTDYHRYVYPDDGMQLYVRRIEGVLHTVQPVATERTDVFVQNSREYSLLRTEHGGWMVMMEVGALLVGRICNLYQSRHRFVRGEEKGWFEFGGSTIVVLTEKGRLDLREDIKKASALGEETRVLQGERTGTLHSF